MQVQRANTLDGILNGDFDDLPELNAGYFSFPVDDFFDNYVDALGQQKGMQGVGATDPVDPGKHDSVQFNSSHPTGPMLSSAMSLDLPMIPDLQTAQPNLAPGNLGLGDLGAAAPPFAHPGPLIDNMGMPLIGGEYMIDQTPNSESGSGNWAPLDMQLRQANGRNKRGGAYADFVDSPGAMEDSDEGDLPNGGGRGGGKTRRNPKQQAQNKQAQQRYRERRKQRFSEMEHAIDGLTAKVEQMQSVQAQNALLQAKRNELEAMLSQKDQEIESLRVRVASGGGAEDLDKSPEQRRRLEEAKIKDCQVQAARHMEELKQYITVHNLGNVNPTGEGTDPLVVQNLAELVGRGCSGSQSAMRAEGVKVLRLMSSDVKHLSRIKCMRKTSKMFDILKRLCLTDLQKEQMLVMRNNHLRNLRSVYEARQQLNMQAMALMLPASARHGDGPKDLDGRMACMSLSGYSKCARQTVDLDEILNSIKENLRLEQKHVMELNFVTMHRLMSPIQAALFLVEMHPAFCDALELANALVSQMKISEEPSSSNPNSGELQNSNSGNIRESPTSSADKSDTCALLQQELQSHGSAPPPPTAA